MANYEQMSDFEINKAVAKALGYKTGWKLGDSNSVGIADGSAPGRYVDYCNNPADAWPVIVENKISLISPTAGQVRKGVNKWAADHDSGAKFWVVHENPLRAAMIVFLMMQESS